MRILVECFGGYFAQLAIFFNNKIKIVVGITIRETPFADFNKTIRKFEIYIRIIRRANSNSTRKVNILKCILSNLL